MSWPKKIICAILLVIAVGLGILVFFQWNNISAAFSFIRFSQEELEGKLQTNDQLIKDAVSDNPQITVREVTQEEREALRDGTMTQEELVQSLLQKTEETPMDAPEPTPEKPGNKTPNPEQSHQQTTQTDEPEKKPTTQKQPEQSEYEKRVNELVASVFVLREEFLLKLDALQAEALAAYKALPAEQRTTSALLSLAGGYLSKGLELEKQCDAEVEAIANELYRLAQEHGGDPTLGQTVFDTYVEEKSLKKAWYMAELKKRGLV